MNTFLISNWIGVAADPLQAPIRDFFTLILNQFGRPQRNSIVLTLNYGYKDLS